MELHVGSIVVGFSLVGSICMCLFYIMLQKSSMQMLVKTLMGTPVTEHCQHMIGMQKHPSQSSIELLLVLRAGLQWDSSTLGEGCKGRLNHHLGHRSQHPRVGVQWLKPVSGTVISTQHTNHERFGSPWRDSGRSMLLESNLFVSALVSARHLCCVRT